MQNVSTKDENRPKWLMFSKFWSCYSKKQDRGKENEIYLSHAFANCSEENEIYSITVKEIAEAQQADAQLKHLFKCNAVLDKGLELQLIENLSCICNKTRLVIPKTLQQWAAMWYHHYLQHPGHTHGSCDILEGYEKYHLVYYKVMQD
jgi:hypothetical protein